MNLSPLMIKKQEFEKSMRGYNVEEVQQFLNKISSEIEKLIGKNKELEDEVEKLNLQIEKLQKSENQLRENIQKTKETSAQALESAKKQSTLIIKESEVKASQMIQHAEEKVSALQNAVLTLREEKDLIIARLKAIVSTQSNLLEGKVKDAGEEPKKPKAQDKAEKLDIDLDGIVDKLL